MTGVAAGPSGVDCFVPPAGGWVAMQSGMRCFMQTGVPDEGVATRDFGTTDRSSKRAVAVRTVP